jgi:hypothetical protein
MGGFKGRVKRGVVRDFLAGKIDDVHEAEEDVALERDLAGTG